MTGIYSPVLLGEQEMLAIAAEPRQSSEVLHMYTKRIHDPDLIPALIAADIQFGAVKVRKSLDTRDVTHKLGQ